MRVTGIYKITSPTGKVYIGQSYNIQKRWIHHKHLSKKKNNVLYKSFKKHGYDNHRFEVIHELPFDVGLETITGYEQFYMDQYRASGVVMLNMTTAAGSTKGMRHSEESIKKMSEAKKRNPNWENGVLAAMRVNKGNKHSLGHHHSDETKLRMSNSRKGIVRNIGRIPWNKGKSGIYSEERRKQLSDAAKARTPVMQGKNHSLEARIKMSNAAKGKVISEETKKKMAAFHIGRTRSEETKLRMREAWKLRKLKIA